MGLADDVTDQNRRRICCTTRSEYEGEAYGKAAAWKDSVTYNSAVSNFIMLRVPLGRIRKI